MTKVAYIRISTGEQNLEAQREAVLSAGAEKIFEEVQSGTNDDRPVLAQCLDYVREGDTLVMTRADRLARSTGFLMTTLKALTDKGVTVVFTAQAELSAHTTPHGKMMLGILASVAEFETDLRKERCREGINNALARGVKFGKTPMSKEKKQEIIDLWDTGKGASEVAKLAGVSRSAAYKFRPGE